MKKPIIDGLAVLTFLVLFAQTAGATPVPLPDGGSSALMLGLGALALGGLRKLLR